MYYGVILVYTEVTSPVAIYAAENWMAVGGMSVNVSLIEQTLGDFNHAYWLRIGVMFDEDAEKPSIVEGVNNDNILAKENAEVVEADELDDTGTVPPPSPHRANTEPDQRGEDQQLYTVAVLSSEIGKLMVPQADDWVDLCAVSYAPFSFFFSVSGDCSLRF